jgi:NAD(P)-dependent dehydrogenase (short-subunit alcohol dehydrogenase family)
MLKAYLSMLPLFLLTINFIMATTKLTWLITGCSSGFGLSLTRAAQAGGHKVIATSRNPSRTPDLVAEIESKGGKWVQLDVDSRDCGSVITELEGSGDHIDVLVNNARYSIYAPIETFEKEEVRAQMETMYLVPCASSGPFFPTCASGSPA